MKTASVINLRRYAIVLIVLKRKFLLSVSKKRNWEIFEVLSNRYSAFVNTRPKCAPARAPCALGQTTGAEPEGDAPRRVRKRAQRARTARTDLHRQARRKGAEGAFAQAGRARPSAHSTRRVSLWLGAHRLTKGARGARGRALWPGVHKCTVHLNKINQKFDVNIHLWTLMISLYLKFITSKRSIC